MIKEEEISPEKQLKVVMDDVPEPSVSSGIIGFLLTPLNYFTRNSPTTRTEHPREQKEQAEPMEFSRDGDAPHPGQDLSSHALMAMPVSFETESELTDLILATSLDEMVLSGDVNPNEESAIELGIHWSTSGVEQKEASEIMQPNPQPTEQLEVKPESDRKSLEEFNRTLDEQRQQLSAIVQQQNLFLQSYMKLLEDADKIIKKMEVNQLKEIQRQKELSEQNEASIPQDERRKQEFERQQAAILESRRFQQDLAKIEAEKIVAEQKLQREESEKNAAQAALLVVMAEVESLKLQIAESAANNDASERQRQAINEKEASERALELQRISDSNARAEAARREAERVILLEKKTAEEQLQYKLESERDESVSSKKKSDERNAAILSSINRAGL